MSPGVRISWSEMWTWNDDTPAMVPAGARISAGKLGIVARSLPKAALTSVKRSPVSCMPSPESPAKRITTSVERLGRERQWSRRSRGLVSLVAARCAHTSAPAMAGRLRGGPASGAVRPAPRCRRHILGLRYARFANGSTTARRRAWRPGGRTARPGPDSAETLERVLGATPRRREALAGCPGDVAGLDLGLGGRARWPSGRSAGAPRRRPRAPRPGSTASSQAGGSHTVTGTDVARAPGPCVRSASDGQAPAGLEHPHLGRVRAHAAQDGEVDGGGLGRVGGRRHGVSPSVTTTDVVGAVVGEARTAGGAQPLPPRRSGRRGEHRPGRKSRK